MSGEDENNFVHGLIGWVLIFLVGYWYWNCSDGIRAAKSMNFNEMFHEKLMPRGLVNYSVLKAEGINVSDLSLEDAIKGTHPKRIEWGSEKLEKSLFGGKETFRVVNVTVVYDPDVSLGKESIVYTFLLYKEHFYHFNPTPVAPLSVAYKMKGSQMKYITMDDSPSDVLESVKGLFKS